jgi:Clostripain family
MHARSITLCVALLLAAVCCTAAAPLAAAGPAVLDPAPQAKWTVMVYMDGDNDLEPWITRDIDREMAATGSSADVQIVALADRGSRPGTADGGWSGARVFNVGKGMKATADMAVVDWGNADMGSPQTLIDFVDWARASFPADRYALFLWDHGWGWWPGNTMRDDTSNDYLDMDELRRAMQTIGGVNMVGMDTCLGQTIEVQAEFRGFAKAMAGCEDSTGYTGFQYGEIIAKLQADPAMGASPLATMAARSIRTGHDRWSLTASAVTFGWRWDRLTAAVSDLGWDMAVRLPQYRRAYAVARRHSASPPQSYSEVRDLYDAAREIRAHVSSSAIRKDCTRVIEALRRVVIYEWSPAVEGDLHGISFYWPAAPAPPRVGSSFSQWVNFPYYCTQLQFTRLTYWSDFLAAWGG